MFGCFRESKFPRKCQKVIECIGIRVPQIQKKKQAILAIQRLDIANLIALGFDNDAFGRIQKLLVDMNNAACYEIIKQYSEDIKTQLPTLLEQRECPQEAKVAVATLIFAAARLSDVPELRNLRRLFTAKYGDQMESFVNSEFVQKFQNKSFPIYEKLQLMQEIAQHHSVRWDCEAFRRENFISLSYLMNVAEEKPNFHQIKEPGHSSNTNEGSHNAMQNEDILCTETLEPTPRIISPKQVQPKPKDRLLVSWFGWSAKRISG